MKDVPMIDAGLVRWCNGFGVVNSTEIIGEEMFHGNELLVKSPKTGVVKLFALDVEEAVENECWDGEFRILRDENKELAIKVWNY